MKINRIFSPSLIVPLILVTPYVPIAHYGISVLEIVVFLFLCALFIQQKKPRIPQTPALMICFVSLYTFGYLGGLINGVLNWNVPYGFWNLNFFYKLLLAIGAFWMGARNNKTIADILNNRSVRFFVLGLCILALVYPFLSYDFRVKYLGLFYVNSVDVKRYFTNPRMPGLGINNVIYSFMLVCFLILSFQAFLKRRTSLLIPTALLLTILSLSSKLAIGLGLLSCFILFIAKVVPRRMAMPYRNVKLLVGLILLVVSGSAILSQTDFGLGLQRTYATISRFEAAFSKDRAEPYGFELRYLKWEKGIERVQLAPILGICKDPFRSQSGSIVGFYGPHNEWIRLWMFYGMAGLIAWLLLISSLITYNLQKKIRLEWILIYGSAIGFMLYDGGMDGSRFVSFWFYLIGLNYSVIRNEHVSFLVSYNVGLGEQKSKNSKESGSRVPGFGLLLAEPE